MKRKKTTEKRKSHSKFYDVPPGPKWPGGPERIGFSFKCKYGEIHKGLSADGKFKKICSCDWGKV